MLIIDAQADPMLGTVIGQGYRIDSFIGAGGMGRVYRGVQLSLDRPIAIKIMRSDRGGDPHMVRRFLQEVRLSSRLDHANIVRVIDGGNTADGRCYLVMEILEGETLDEHVPAGGLPLEEALGLFAQLCAGVEAFHRVGLVHRDLKPSNVILCPARPGEWQVKIFDFGLAKSLDPDLTGLTAEGEFLGTPGYLAPEQMSSGEIGPPTDIYALGAILHFMLSKRPAFRGASGPAILMNQLSGEFVTGELSDAVPLRLREVIERALAVDPAARFTSMQEFIGALGPLPGRDLTGPQSSPIRESSALSRVEEPAVPERAVLSRRAWLLGAGGVAAGAGLGFGAWAWRTRKPILLGMSGTLSGVEGAIGKDMSLGLQARFAAANRGSELRAKIELEVRDDGYEPARALANVEHFALDKLALVGNVGTATTAACVPALLAAKLPLLGAHSGAEHLRRDPPDRYVFNFRAGYALETAALIKHFMREQVEPSSIAIFAQDDAFGDSGIEGVRRALADYGFLNFEELLTARYPAKTVDTQDAVAAIEARPELRVVILIAAPSAAAHLVAKLAGLRTSLSFAGISPVSGSVFAQELRNLGHDPSAIILTQVVPDPASSANGVLRFREALERHQPGSRPSVVSLEGFIVADLLVEALRRAGPRVGREELVETLESLRELDLGFGTPVSFSPSDHQGSKQVWAMRFGAGGKLEPFELS